jgi:hypothetical protein
MGNIIFAKKKHSHPFKLVDQTWWNKSHMKFIPLKLILAYTEEKIFLTLANQKQELPLAAIFVGGMGRNEETL